MAGKVDSKGRFSGVDVVYLFPDCITCYIGTFDDCQMVSAKIGLITGHFVNGDGILELVAEVRDGHSEGLLRGVWNPN